MKQAEGFFGVPYLVINKNFDIQHYNKELEDVVGLSQNFLNMLDESSVKKVQHEVTPSKRKNRLEVTLLSPVKESMLFDLYIVWKNDLQATMMLIPKDEHLMAISASLARLQERLNSTNFELLEEKEKLQESIETNYRLSAPFIKISPDTAVIPLFGDINHKKMEVISEPILQKVQQADVERLLFDFTAVGDFENAGMEAFGNIVRSLIYMGHEIVIIGVTPDQARKINEWKIKLPLKFISSLQQAIHIKEGKGYK